MTSPRTHQVCGFSFWLLLSHSSALGEKGRPPPAVTEAHCPKRKSLHGHGGANMWLPSICSFYLPVNCPPPHWGPRPLSHSLAQDGIQVSLAWLPVSPIFLMGLPYVQNGMCFPPVYLSYINLIIRPNNLTREEGKIFPPSYIHHQHKQENDNHDVIPAAHNPVSNDVKKLRE